VVKWWDALEAICRFQVAEGLQLARGSQAPDAQWLCALRPPSVGAPPVAVAELLAVMKSRHHDPRALYITAFLDAGIKTDEQATLIQRSAELCFASAQALQARVGDRLLWAHKAVEQRDRAGMLELAVGLWSAEGPDGARAVELCKEAADLGQRDAQF
jgi:hypothetical protein